MYKFVRSIFFLFDPEKIHHFVFKLTRFSLKIPGMKWIWKKAYVIEDPALEKELFGLKFKNPVGLAAGFDKDGKLYNELEYCGFGFVEVGTVTPKAQVGNPKKRLFRLKQDKALINRMGFNNGGVQVLVSQLKKRKTKMIIGGNIGKNTDTKPEDYTKDYVECFKELHPHVDYFTLNVSCPNVGSHAKLQDKDYLLELVGTLQALNNTFKVQRPILLKIAPDLNNIQLDEIIELMAETKLEGVISTNTTVSREGLLEPNLEAIGNGGLSGKPLAQKATEVIKYLADKSNKAFPIIGVGGIHSEEDALEKIAAGADLVQIYTGFIYEGPGLVKRINKAILKK